MCEQEPFSPSAKLKTLNNEELTKTARRLQVEAPRLVSQLRGDLDWIVLKCLEKDRTRRYATANALAMDIERYLHEEAVLARPPSQLYRLQKLARRNRVAFAAGGVAVVALLLGTIVSTLMFLESVRPEASEARLRKEAELREESSRIALLVTQRRFEEADKLLVGIPLDKPSIEVAAELRALGDWHAAKGRWQQAAERFALVGQGGRTRRSRCEFSRSIKAGGSLASGGRPPRLRTVASDHACKVHTGGWPGSIRVDQSLLVVARPTDFAPVAPGGLASGEDEQRHWGRNPPGRSAGGGLVRYKSFTSVSPRRFR